MLFTKKLKILSIFFSTIVLAMMFIDEIKPELLRPQALTSFQSKKDHETKEEYFKRIGKTEYELKYEHLTNQAQMIMQVLPIATSIVILNPLLYVSYGATIAVSLPTGLIVKKLVNDSRPDDVDNKNSFPSGHTVFAFITTTLIFLFIKHIKSKFFIGFCLFIFSCLIGYGRILANRHWYIDILGGACFGAFFASLVYVLLTNLNYKLKVFDYRKGLFDKKDI